jgi:hypothetical protein
VHSLLLAAALLALGTAGRAAAQDEGYDDEPHDEGGRARVRLTAWGGEAFVTSGSGRSSPILGGEAAWAFDAVDVGVAGYGYRHLRDATRDWAPVVLLRLTERFQTHRGLEAAVTFGAGAARPSSWKAWFQVALGARLDLGPIFLAGEFAFEQNDLLHLTGGLGVAF